AVGAVRPGQGRAGRGRLDEGRPVGNVVGRVAQQVARGEVEDGQGRVGGPVGLLEHGQSSRSSRDGTGPPPSGIQRPESRHLTASWKPCAAANSWNQRPSGEWRVMPSNSVARIWVPCRPMLSYAWLIMSFCMASWLVGTPAMRSA